jgi:primosomal protein N' (replication factor Y)
MEFDYLPPVNTSASQLQVLAPGVRVRVPFGRRETTGYLIAVIADSHMPQSKLKAALEILDDTSLINPTIMSICLWAAAY